MKRVVRFQIFATLVVALLSFLIGGEHAAASAILIGSACLVPNAMLVATVAVVTRYQPTASPYVLLIGEFIKIVAIGLLLYLIVVLYRDLVWPVTIVTLVAVLNCSFLGFLTRE